MVTGRIIVKVVEDWRPRRMTNRAIGYWLFLAASVLLAIGALIVAIIIGQREGLYEGGVASLWMAAAWSALIAVGLLLYGKRGLWMLTGAPIVLFVPIFFLFFWDGGCGGTGCL
jgi:hypothetical protein